MNNHKYVNLRNVKRKQIPNVKNQIKHIDSHSYKIKSQSYNREYEIISTELNWHCSCYDSVFHHTKFRSTDDMRLRGR